ncbi:MAG: hypothetical protein WBM24_17240 [Candidatus Sulfotelmatobacter sp.]
MSTSAVSSVSLNQQLQSYFQTRNSDLQQLGKALSSGDLANAQVAYNSITALGQEGPFANGNPFLVSQREKDFTAIGQALQAGDLAGAQQAFSTLQETFRGNTPKGPTAQPVSSSAAGAAATSGGSTGPEIVLNLSSNSGGTSPTTAASNPAPEIVINLSNSATASPAAPAAAPSTASPEIVLNLNSTGTSPEEITIGINSSSNGEQVSISVGNPGSNNQGSTSQGSNAPQLTLNLGANTNEQIVLNFLNALSSTTSTSSTSGSSASGGVSVSA